MQVGYGGRITSVFPWGICVGPIYWNDVGVVSESIDVFEVFGGGKGEVKG